ncbi:RNA polymerase sigma factor [Aeromicrobium phragmitis]|uniref:RNA polymerase sigma factor n=1 Tax=Aeromicrobium phragmitis TaxID=2478914 RepID=UPI00140ACC9F|nr:sigma-70 family RNA polymerase sigma factor [Aeromicrobium phragmitis]
MTTEDAVEEAWREHWPRLLALLTARFERVDLAEDALAEAFARAARRWPTDGVPASPVAWLHRVAQREVIDRLRSEVSAHRAAARIAEDLAQRVDPGEPQLEAVADDMLRLVFLACHPALPPHAQTALALRWVLGLPTTEIARLFAVAPTAMSARLTRARQRAAAEPRAFELPTGAALDDRVEGVLRTAHLLFTSGYAPSEGTEVVRPEVCAEAIRLVAVVDDLLPGRADVQALRSLVELQHARRDARADAAGDFVLLAEQDRRRWRHDEIARAMERLLALGPSAGFAEELRLQALIAAVHAVALHPDETDWPLALTFYDRLLALSGEDRVVRLNRAVAVARVHGAAQALTELGMLDPRDHRTAGALAELHAEAGNPELAAALFTSAAHWCACDPVRRHYQRRAREITTA